jgi:arsenite/tail-anchored protein-transporting ATPase
VLAGQDVSGGKPVRVEGTDLPLWGMEIDVEDAKAELREATGKDGGKGVDEFLGGMGLGVVSDQLRDLQLGELPPPPPASLPPAPVEGFMFHGGPVKVPTRAFVSLLTKYPIA